jgi:hypothetical protein
LSKNAFDRFEQSAWSMKKLITTDRNGESKACPTLPRLIQCDFDSSLERIPSAVDLEDPTRSE